MTLGFVLLALAIVILAMAILLRPLGNRMRLLPMLGVTSAMAGMVALLYMMIGTPAALNPQLSQPATNITDAIAQLEARVQAAPKDTKALVLLAQAYATTGKPELVEPTLAKAVAADPSNADVYAEAAETLIATSQDRKISDTAMGYLKHAISLNANHQRARWFLGIAQRQRGDDKGAIETWTSLLPLVDRSAGEALLLEVNDARKNVGMPLLTDDALKPIAKESVIVAVEIPDAIRQKVGNDAIVFISAKSKDGSGMPLAAKRYSVADLPSKIFLSDRDSPMPTAKLSQVKDVIVTAKISLTGSATADASDLHSTEVEAAPGSAKVSTLRFGDAP